MIQFLCNRQDLLEAVQTCKRAVSTRSSSPLLEGVLIEAGQELTLFGYDQKLGIETRCAADIQQQGRLVVEPDILESILKKLPDGAIHFEERENCLVKLSCQQVVFEIHGLDAEGYPLLPRIEEGQQQELLMAQKDLRKMIASTRDCISRDVNRPNLTGALFKAQGHRAEMVAIDGYRMAIYRVDKAAEDQPWGEYAFIIPGSTLSELYQALKDKGELRILADSTHIEFRYGETRMISNLVAGAFMEYEKFFPKSYQTAMTIDSRALRSALERALILTNSDEIRFPLNLEMKDEQYLHVRINTVKGGFKDQIELESAEGPNIKLDFNPFFFQEVVRVLDDEKVRLEFSGSIGPCVVSPLEGDRYSYLMLPLRG